MCWSGIYSFPPPLVKCVARPPGWLLYVTDDGRLDWDGDGAGAGLRLHLAALSNLPALSAADFVPVWGYCSSAATVPSGNTPRSGAIREINRPADGAALTPAAISPPVSSDGLGSNSETSTT